jgi:DNA invertase Pin-like site-specific DNA recombinase
MMKAILIARVSTEEQREAGNSLPAQVARLEKYCQNKNFEILKICSFDESAYTNDRTEFDRIIDFVLAQKEKIAVCCDKVDRLSRNIFDSRISALYERALRDEIELHFASDGQIITSRISAVEKFQFGISLGLAKYYSDAISDNVRRAIEQKLRKGEWPGRAPYGYDNVRLGVNQKDIVINDYKARTVLKAFELYGTGAYSMDLLCKKMQQDYGLKWSKGFLNAVLNNPFYYGTMLCKGQLYPHRYAPIITQSLFEEVQNVKNGFQKKQYKYAGQPYVYRGLLRCADCGLAITPEKHKGHVYYHCTQYKGKHGAKWLREETITEQLEIIFKKFQMPKNIVEEIMHMLSELHENKIEFHNKHYNELTKEHKSLTHMLDNLYLDKLKGRITEEYYDRFYQSLRDQVVEVNAKLGRLQEAEDNYYHTAKSLLELSTRAHEIFVGSEVEVKRQLIKLVLSNLRIEDGNVVCEAKKPFDLIMNCSDRMLWLPHLSTLRSFNWKSMKQSSLLFLR